MHTTLSSQQVDNILIRSRLDHLSSDDCGETVYRVVIYADPSTRDGDRLYLRGGCFITRFRFNADNLSLYCADSQRSEQQQGRQWVTPTR